MKKYIENDSYNVYQLKYMPNLFCHYVVKNGSLKENRFSACLRLGSNLFRLMLFKFNDVINCLIWMAQCGLAGESILGIKMCKHNGKLGKVISINIRWSVVNGSVSMAVQAQIRFLRYYVSAIVLCLLLIQRCGMS